ncbi:MAG: ferredoxin [Nanoarchaeota archaeon]|nr:ferredoxin [Nanoarchaeota archaeon]
MVYKITHDKEGCIGCGACAAIDEKNWEMDDEGKSKLVGTDKEEKEFPESELASHKETAEACPVNVIHVYKDDEKLV